MPETKKDVTTLNNEAPAFARLTAGGVKGLGDLLDEMVGLINRLSNQVLNAPAVAMATVKSKVKTTNAVTYFIDGVSYYKAASDDLWTLTGAALADGYVRKYLLLLDTAGAASVLASNDLLTAAVARLTLPAVPKGKCVIGVLQVSTAAAAFTPGTTLLDAGTVTATYTDGLPAAVAGPPTVPVLV